MLTAEELFTSTVANMPPDERLRLAVLILDELSVPFDGVNELEAADTTHDGMPRNRLSDDTDGEQRDKWNIFTYQDKN